MTKRGLAVTVGGVLLVWTGVALFAAMQAWLAAEIRGLQLDSRSFLLQQISPVAVWALATPFIIWSARRFPVLGAHAIRNAGLHFAAGTAFIFASNIVIRIPGKLLRGDLSGLWRDGVVGFVSWYHMALIVYAVIVALGHVSLYLQARREQELAASQLRAELAEAQLNVMRMQLRPHFLFNALNSVGQLVRLGRVLEANDMIERLGLLLRATLKGEGRQEVAVRQELQTARAYLSIEEVRFGDRLRVVWRISADTLDALVPQLLIQPIIENSIRHAVAKRLTPTLIEIRTEKCKETLVLTVSDDGPGIPLDLEADEARGLGLANTRDRLRNLYGDRQSLSVGQRRGGGTEVGIEIPYRLCETAAVETSDGTDIRSDRR